MDRGNAFRTLTLDNEQNVPARRIRHSIVGDAPEIANVLSLCIPDVQVGGTVRECRLRPLGHVVVIPFPAHMLFGQRFALDAAGQRHVLARAHNGVLGHVYNGRSVYRRRKEKGRTIESQWVSAFLRFLQVHLHSTMTLILMRADPCVLTASQV